MPIYEYRCSGCKSEFEQLVRTGDTPACPSCGSTSLERLLSLTSVSTEGTRAASLYRAKQKAKLVQRARIHEVVLFQAQPSKPGQPRV